MKYCLSSRQKYEYLKKADSIKVAFRDRYIAPDLFEKYSENIAKVNHNDVQRFYRSGKHWFYDLESILVNAGINTTELGELHKALDGCVIYKAHTPKFMNDFEIHTFSGFSMYLPCQGSESLDAFYRTLKWNQDTGLVN